MEYEDVIVTKKEGIATVTLSQPDTLNALTFDMQNHLALAIEGLKYDDEVRVLVLTGAGKGFCSGSNTRSLGTRAASDTIGPIDRVMYIRNSVHGIARALFGLGKPSIAMVNGPAIGAGCDMAMVCDLRVASEKARFGEIFVKLGIVPGNGGMYLLPRLVGVAKACELILTGDIIDAREAERIGLVNRVVPAEELEVATMELAAKIAAGPPIAIRLARAGIYDCLTRDLYSSLDYSSLVMGVAQSTEDHKEGTRAFAEKRQPMFKGR